MFDKKNQRSGRLTDDIFGAQYKKNFRKQTLLPHKSRLETLKLAKTKDA